MPAERLLLDLAATGGRGIRGRHARAVRRPEHVLGRRHIVHIGQLAQRGAHSEVRRDKRDLHDQHAGRHRAGRVSERRPRVLRRVRRVHRAERGRAVGRPADRRGPVRAVRRVGRVAEAEGFFEKLRGRVQRHHEERRVRAGGVAVVPGRVGGQNRR